MDAYCPEWASAAVTHRGGIEMSISAPLSAAHQLLLLLARLSLSDDQQRAALDLCSQISDWDCLARQARQRFVLPLVYRHLRHLDPSTIPSAQWESMRRQSLAIVQQNLYAATAIQRLVCELLEPLGIPYVFFKGHALATRYYDDPALRFCRDIDLLVPRDRMVELVEIALKRGYTPHAPQGLIPDRTSLAFAVRVRPVISLMSPQGVPVEIHHQIDKSNTIYETDELVAGSETDWLGDTQVSVMPTAELFVYACLHHTRHYWSHLHWLVDLDAMQQHPDFNLEAVYACAERRNLTTTVEASLELYRVCAQPEPWRDKDMGRHGQSLLEACLTNLQGNQEVELALRHRQAAADYPFAWQTSLGDRLHWRVKRLTHSLQPTYADYQSLPLPEGLHWVYLMTRPFRGLLKRIVANRFGILPP
ncbi:nucleotidyltransferase family protein [Halomonas kalidii]|uniref:Nucleotidyltransferase family protein n=1 Tax=Halomonas kalidii TaxID=3043293 RepID=A0ABT6VJL8_9GAMM|nr:nucleotidyltransferase family protein [Halomonas kalidii]MDI5934177.1 nucleotidyltransferase family protein [Halomonas kalidii]